MGEIIVIASGKGGVGKSMFAVNVAATLAQQHKSVVLIDMNMGLRNLDMYLGLENSVVYDIADVLSGMCRIKKAMIRDHRFEELYLIPAAQYKNTNELAEEHMQVFCAKLKPMYDYVIIDSAAGIDKNLRLAATAADKAVIVTTPEYVTLRDADMADRVLEKMGIQKRCYCVNKVKAELFGTGWIPSFSEISQILRTNMVGIIQYDENIHIASNVGIPIVCKADAYITKNFKVIAERIITM